MLFWSVYLYANYRVLRGGKNNLKLQVKITTIKLEFENKAALFPPFFFIGGGGCFSALLLTFKAESQVSILPLNGEHLFGFLFLVVVEILW